MQNRLSPPAALYGWMEAISRRRFVRWAAASTSLSAGVACRRTGTTSNGSDAGTSPHAQGERPRVLTPDEWRVLEALTCVILPSDDGVGAREANVVAFIDAQLATEELSPLAPALREIVRRIDAHARAHNGHSFSDLLPSAQQEITAAFARGESFGDAFPAREAFGALHSLTLEGFLSDPNHGGNAGGVGWRYVDFPEPELRTPGARHHHPLPVIK